MGASALVIVRHLLINLLPSLAAIGRHLIRAVFVLFHSITHAISHFYGAIGVFVIGVSVASAIGFIAILESVGILVRGSIARLARR